MENDLVEVLLRGESSEHLISARSVILCAGAANAQLSVLAGILPSALPQQLRPLHMVMARSPSLPPVFGHCVGLSDKPKITITSQADACGRTVWYIGGLVAEEGVGRSREAQVAAARAAVRECIGWVDTSDTEWSTFVIDRAEGLVE
jgi:hypothetical protein